MKNNKNDQRSNMVYYVALALGLVALAVLIGIYTYNNSNRNSDQYVSLDSEEDSYADASLEETAQGVNAAAADAKNSDEVADANSTDTDAIGKADLASNTTTATDTEEETTTKDDKEENTSTEKEDTKDDDASASNKITEEKNKTETESDTQSGTKTNTTKENTKETSTGTFGQSLVWPVQGNVLLPYSMDSTVYYQTLDAYKSSCGMVISSKKGTSVTAACTGTVTDITKSDIYGNVVTVDIGDGYTLQYGQLDNISVAVGDHISEGQQFGQIAEPTASFLMEGANLYFALQKDGSYVNPQDFLK